MGDVGGAEVAFTSDLPAGYESADVERLTADPAGVSKRTAFARDRARVLHCSSLRRLAAKTQVLQAGEEDFPRTRLTHTLEVAQIGRELGAALGADADLVDAAGLCHDLGHPPFGHNGEDALQQVAAAIGGFEGNAQSLRLLMRLEHKAFTPEGTSAGLNLTRAALDATIKYPWLAGEEPPGASPRKFNAYADDADRFAWVRQGAPAGHRSFEAQVMDWADDVAYSVHDVEDAIQQAHLDLEALQSGAEREQVAALAQQWYAHDTDPAQLLAALDRLRAEPFWPRGFDGGSRSLAALKGMTSALIGRFCIAAEVSTRAAYPGRLTRYAGDLVVPASFVDEVAVLKALANRYVMQRHGVEEIYHDQRQILIELCEALALRQASGEQVLDEPFAEDYASALDSAGRLRAVVDQVASLTDLSVQGWHHEFVIGG